VLHQGDIAHSTPRWTLMGSARARTTLTSQCLAGAPSTGTSKCEAILSLFMDAAVASCAFPGRANKSKTDMQSPHDRTLTKRMPRQLSYRGAWLERAHHSLENTPLRQACCERHRHTSADLAAPCVSPRGFSTLGKQPPNMQAATHRYASHG
jgi:hypothetical protein